MRKILKIILISLLVLILLAVAGLYFIYSSSKQSDYSANEPMDKAFLFAQKSNKKQCLSKYWDVYKICDDEACYEKSEEFIKVCLAFSRGEKDKLCESKDNFDEAYTNLLNSVEFCKDRGFGTKSCKQMNSVLREYCAK